MHYSVLKKELIESLNIKSTGIYVDATLGYAGDASEILRKIKRGYLFAFDQDPDAVAYSTKLLCSIGSNYKIFPCNFVNMKECLKSENITGVDGIIFDLGFSSPQIDSEERGFSFMHDGPLDMRMSKEGASAKDIIDTYSVDELSNIFYKYGEERLSKVIARKIKENVSNINTTLELVDVIRDAVGANYFYSKHPERKIFQALRIEVNGELKVIEEVLPDAIKLLNKGGRLCVITFHSLEDRIVKNIFKKYSEVDALVKGEKDIPDEYKPLIKLVNKKPILPSDEELKENSRSNSAKLRIVERI